MAAKRIQLSADDTTYYTLPGNSGELRHESAELNDTIFGQSFASSESGLINWGVNANAIYKGFAGYIVALKKGGTPIAMTGEAMSLVSGKTYRITAATKRYIDMDTVPVVLDNAVDNTDEVESINYLAGTVTFKASYTPTGPITITGAYVPTTEIAGAKSFTLTQTAEAIDSTDIPTAKANGGFQVFDANGLKTVTLELSGIYKASNAFVDALNAREQVYIEINPDNSSLSVARGIFKFASQGQSGDVGALEEETISLRLNVPDNSLMATPFTWIFDPNTTLSAAVRTAINAWLGETKVYVKYLPDGVNGEKGEAVVTDISLSGGLEAMNEFTVNLQGSGALEATP